MVADAFFLHIALFATNKTFCTTSPLSEESERQAMGRSCAAKCTFIHRFHSGETNAGQKQP